MDTQTKRDLLVYGNLLIAVWYGWLAVAFASIWGVVLVSANLQVSRRTAITMIVGSSLFLGGCAIHHLHLGLETIPNSIDRYGDTSRWIIEFWHHFAMTAAQAVGAPLLLLPGMKLLLGRR